MSDDKVDANVQIIVQAIADESHPDRMTPSEAKRFYESIATWLEASLDGLEDDLAD